MNAVETEPLGVYDRVWHRYEYLGMGTVVGLTDDPRFPYEVSWDDEDIIGGAYADDEIVSED